MAAQSTPNVIVIIPNWNGAHDLPACLDSLLAQTLTPHVVVVDNGSVDSSVALLESQYPTVELIKHDYNKGFAGGVNPGFRRAIELNAAYAVAFNNDAVADDNWLKCLVSDADSNPSAGIVTCCFMHGRDGRIDSTGDIYTSWGLPYPRGRGEALAAHSKYGAEIFGASGGASLYRVSMLKEIGLFDEDFFAYYEDVDLSFRAQLAGWKVRYVPEAIAYHQIGATSSRIKGFTTYQTMKNLPLLLFKNVPRKYLFRVGWRFFLAHTLFFGRAVSRGQGWAALKGDATGTYLLFKKFEERRHIQKNRKVPDAYIWRIMTHDLPPNAHALRALRARWWRFLKKT